MNLINTVYEILKPLNLPTQYVVRPSEQPCISYHFFGEGTELHGDGSGKMEGQSLQIDLFGKESDCSKYRLMILAAMKEYKGKLIISKVSSEQPTPDPEVNLYHQISSFNINYETC